MDLDFLTQTQLFRDIPVGELSGLLNCLRAVRRQYEKGAVLCSAGERTASIGLVLSGSVHIESDDVWGNKSILSSVGPGQVFAETYACLPDEPLMVSVTAAEDTAVLFLHAPHMLAPCTQTCTCHAQLIRNLLFVSARKNLELSRRAFHTAPKTIRGRLLSYLSMQAIHAGSDSFSIPFDRQQLADYLGVDRSALSAELGRMRRDGLLDFKKNRFRLHGAPDAPV